MRTPEEVGLVLSLGTLGWNKSEIARETAIPYRTVSRWLAGGTPDPARSRADCPVCSGRLGAMSQPEYTYLLGQYLGDGCIYKGPRGVYRLGVFCSEEYPRIMQACERAIAAVLSSKVGRSRKRGCVEVYSYSKHWPCLFPQHGPGMKHTRKIELADWQQALVDEDPRPLIRGLIHSDGCRVLNRATGTDYPPYPRYHFTNTSADIRAIFTRACDAIGVKWRQNNATNISIARRDSVAILDSFIGPKY
jgi:hypothetical protein